MMTKTLLKNNYSGAFVTKLFAGHLIVLYSKVSRKYIMTVDNEI